MRVDRQPPRPDARAAHASSSAPCCSSLSTTHAGTDAWIRSFTETDLDPVQESSELGERFEFLTEAAIVRIVREVPYESPEQFDRDRIEALTDANDAKRIAHNLRPAPEPSRKETEMRPSAPEQATVTRPASATPESPDTVPAASASPADSSLDAALLACQRELRTIGRDGYNDHADYTYTSADHWIATSHDVLHRHDLMARRERWTVTP